MHFGKKKKLKFCCLVNAKLTNGQLQKGTLSADTIVGQGNTTSWKMCGLDRTTCLTIFFDVSPSEKSSQSGMPNPQLYIQFLTKCVVFFFTIIFVPFLKCKLQ